MTTIFRAAGLLFLAGCCLAGTIFAGAHGRELRAAAPAAPVEACCIYMIF